MKLLFQGSLAIFTPFGFLQNAPEFKIKPEQKRQILIKNSACALLSLKYVALFDEASVKQALAELISVCKELKISAGVCDFSDALCDLLAKFCGNTPGLSLFETRRIASLFLGERVEECGEILLFNENAQYRRLIQGYLKERGYDTQAAVGKREFSELKPKFECAIGSKTHAVFSSKDLEIFIRKEAVIYRASGLIDSEFASKFDKEGYERFLRSGFKNFAFWINTASGLNAHGASFLIKLSAQAAKLGATLALCGLNEGSLSESLVLLLKGANILIYKNLDAFFDGVKDASSVSARTAEDAAARRITKDIVEILPQIVSCATGVLEPLYGENFTASTQISPFSYEVSEGGIYASALFYGEFEMKIILALEISAVQKMRKILCIEDENGGAREIFELILTRISAIFAALNLNTKLCVPKICGKYARGGEGKGAQVFLSAGQTQVGALFVTK